MPTDERMLNMLLLLLERTKRGDQDWQRVPEREDPDYETNIGNWTVEIQTVDGDGNPPYRLSVIADSEEIEMVQTTKIPPNLIQSAKIERQKANIALRELYDRARRKATGADDAIDEINRLLSE